MSFENIRFESLKAADIPLLTRWLQEPHVRPFWEGEADEAAADAHYLSVDREISGFLIYMNDHPVGFIQCQKIGSAHKFYAWVSSVGETWGINLLIGEAALTGISLAQSVIEQFICKMINEHPKISLILVDPNVDNKRAIRAYAKADFHPVLELKIKEENILLMRRRV